MTAASDDDGNHTGKPLLAMLPACHLTDETKEQLYDLADNELFVERSTDEDVERAIDEANWISIIDSLRYMVTHNLRSDALLMYAGVSYITEAEGTRKLSNELKVSPRRVAALLLRMVAAITLLVTPGIPLATSWQPREEATALTLRPLADRKFGLRSRTYRVS